MKFRVRIDTQRCKGCGLCIHACPRQVLRMVEQFNSKGYHYVEAINSDACIGCIRCADMCPDTAIEIDRLYASNHADEAARTCGCNP